MKRWSSAQLQAIEDRQLRLLISAGAGSGKTSVLVERVLQRVLQDGVNLDQMLIVTFTEAAAAEMKERIERALYDAVKSDQGRRAASQLHLLERAQISTLHSFCLRLIRQGVLELSLTPGFRIADGNEAAMLLEQSLQDWLDEWLEIAGQASLDFALRYGDMRGDDNLRKWLKQLYYYVQSQPEPDTFLLLMATWFEQSASGPLAESVYAKPYAQRIKRQLYKVAEHLQEALTLSVQPDGPAPYVALLQSELEQVVNLIRLAEELHFQELSVLPVNFATLPSAKEADPDLKERAQKLRDQAKKTLKDLHLQERTPELLEVQMQALVPFVNTLVTLLQGLTAAYERAKRARGIVDFQDLEQLAYQLLKQAATVPKIKEELGRQFKEIMVDEYQDTSPLQDAILEALAKLGDPLFFMVGDVKQSIYRFRMADPSLFLEKINNLRNVGQVIDMNENFRSRSEVAAAVNLLFGQLFTRELGGIVYDDFARMLAKANYGTDVESTLAHPVELHLVESGELENDTAEDESVPVDSDFADSYVNELAKMEREGVVIGRQIKALISANAQVLDKETSGYRPLEYRDMAILVRSDQGKVEALTGMLRRLGIPATATADSGFFSGYEIKLALSFLQVLDNPLQDIPLISVLRSVIGQFSDEELAQIRVASKGSFFAALKKVSLQGEEAGLREKAIAFLQRLEEWRTLARTLLLTEAVGLLLRDSGLLQYFRVAPDGNVRAANLLYLERLATVFASVNGQSLRGFVHYLEEHLENSDLNLGGGKAFSENDNVVRIMTIHKSKGLEFPVVFVAGLGQQFNLRHDSPFYLHRKFGFGLKETDMATRERLPTVTSMALQEIEDLESLAEEIRVLYVALTRARERLVLVASARDVAKTLERTRTRLDLLAATEESLPAWLLTQAKTFLEWILLGIMQKDPQERIVQLKIWEQLEDFAIFEQERSNLTHDYERVVRLDPTVFAEVDDTVVARRAELMHLAEAQVAKRQSERGVALAAKISVSEWRQLHDEGEVQDITSVFANWRSAADPKQMRPRFMQQLTALTGAEQGTLFHRFMQHFTLADSIPSTDDVRSELERQLRKGILDAREAEGVFWEGAAAFFAHPLGVRLWQARVTLKREVPFTLSVTAQTLVETATAADRVVVQGVVDSLFAENGQLVIVDYKTDRVSGNDSDLELAQKYLIQLQLYAEAISKGYQKPVKEAWLFYVRSGRAICVIGPMSVIRS